MKHQNVLDRLEITDDKQLAFCDARVGNVLEVSIALSKGQERKLAFFLSDLIKHGFLNEHVLAREMLLCKAVDNLKIDNNIIKCRHAYRDDMNRCTNCGELQGY